MRSPYRTSVPRAGRRRMLAWVRFVGIAQEGFCNTYDYAHCGACAASNCRGISRAFQILGFCYAPNRCASLTRSWPRRVRFNALTNIPSGELLLEYKGEVTSWRVASQRYQRNRAEDGHTFFFGLDGAYVIDGARGGNSARWLNHCCEPNCEAEQEGSRVFIRTIADIMPGEELFIDYLLDVKGRRTAAVKKLHACRCGARHCRGTMLAPR